MSETAGTIAGISIASLALIISLICLSWILIRWMGSKNVPLIKQVYDVGMKADLFRGGYE